jgi:hypothetical protein
MAAISEEEEAALVRQQQEELEQSIGIASQKSTGVRRKVMGKTLVAKKRRTELDTIERETIGIFARTHSSIYFEDAPESSPPGILLKKYTIGSYGKGCSKFFKRTKPHKEIVLDVVYQDMTRMCSKSDYRSACEHSRMVSRRSDTECLMEGSCQQFTSNGSDGKKWHVKLYQTVKDKDDLPEETISLLLVYNKKIINLLSATLEELIDFFGIEHTDYITEFIRYRELNIVVTTGHLFQFIWFLKQKNNEIKYVNFLDEGCNNLMALSKTTIDGKETTEVNTVPIEQLSDPRFKRHEDVFYGGKKKSKRKYKRKSRLTRIRANQ